MIFVKLLAVIAMWFAALQVWDIATFQFAQVLRTPIGALRFIGGCVLGFCALGLLYASLPIFAVSAFSWVAICTFLGALAAEFLVGEELRVRIRAAFHR